MTKTGKLTLLLLLIATVSCKSSEEILQEPLAFEPFYTINDSLKKDPDIENWLKPYREIYEQEMGRRIARANGPLTFGQPESSLGNLATDIIRYRAIHEYQKFVHIAVMNPDGFQLEFEEGDITLGDLYEFMPYDNTLVILEMRGQDVRELADEIAEKGGVPLSGMRMTIVDGKATGVLVDSESLEADKIYLVATSSYVARGGGGFHSMQNGLARHDYSVLIRDIFIDYMRSRREFTPVEDLRIRTR